MKYFKTLILFMLPVAFFYSCDKWEDPNPDVDPRITARKYCNDPEALNYNWDFPGLPDSTVCIFPADIFEGSYSFTDSIYFNDNSFDTSRTLQTYTIHLIPTSKSKFRLAGFCSGNDLLFTTERTSYRATTDTTLKFDDTTFAYGQPLCRIQDTLTGTIAKSKDSLSNRIFIEWMVVSDSGINYHKGTAIKL